MSASLSVLHVVPSLDHGMGGSVQAALLMSDALAAGDVDSRVVATFAAGDELDYIRSEFNHVSFQVFERRPPAHYYRSPALRRGLLELAREVNIFHVHGVFNFPAAYGLSAASKYGVASVLSPHGQLDPYDLRRHRVAKSIYGRGFLRRALAGIDATVVTSDREGAALHTFGAALPTRTIGLPVRPISGGSGRRLRDRLGIPANALVVLFLGRIDPKKRVDIILQSVAKAGQLIPGLHTLVVGDGDPRYVRGLRELSVRLGTETSTTWAGTLRGQQKADALEASNIFILPSENENFGITVAEALLAGVPAVISDKVYLHDWLADEGLATVCQTTVDSCASALLAWATDPERLGGSPRRVRKVATSLFSPSAVADRLSETYLRAIGTRS